MATIGRTRDRLGREVVSTDARLAHILGRHADMAGRLDEVRVAVEAPKFVTRDAKYPHRANHYRRRAPGQTRVKAVVHYRPAPPQGTWVGEVITAHATGIVPRTEHHVWP